MRFDLTDLRLFVNVVDAGSLTAGAAATQMTLAAASARVRALESRFGTGLLRRHARGVEPTEAGVALAGRARGVLAGIARMERELARRPRPLRALANTAASRIDLPRVLDAFLQAWPQAGLAVDERRSEAIVDALARGEADLGLVSDAVDPGGLDAIVLREDPRVAVVGGGHRLAGRLSVRLEELAAETWIGLPVGRALQDHVDAQAGRLGAEPRYGLRVDSFGAVCRHAARGAGVAILPRAAAARLAPAGARTVALDHPWARRRLLLCARSLRALPPAARCLADALRGRAAEVA
jgi:DNA-binding transcriptional LysR family regulator